jgi:hypothetical protein
MATTAAADRTPKRKLIDLLLAKSAGQDLPHFADTRRTDGDSWGDVAAKVYGLTGETVSVPWLIRQCDTDDRAA